MSRGFRRGALAALAAVLALALTAAPAMAHEQRTVGGGKYQFTVGWQHEPTYTGVLNAVQIFVKDANGTPIDDLGSPPSLQVTVTTGTQTSTPLELRASWDPDTGLGTHGEFDASIIPTTPGTYTLHFTGTVNGTAIKEDFTSSDKTFDNVVDPTSVQFPTKLPNTADLATSVSRLVPRVDTALASGHSAHNKADSSGTLALVALIVGAALGAGGILVGVTGRRKAA